MKILFFLQKMNHHYKTRITFGIHHNALKYKNNEATTENTNAVINNSPKWSIKISAGYNPKYDPAKNKMIPTVNILRPFILYKILDLSRNCTP